MPILTPAQLANPHRSTFSPRHGESMSTLERSFSTRNMFEINEWISLGVVKDAMAGNARSRRKYSSLLMSRFLSGVSRHPMSQQMVDERNKVVSYLWEHGASQHKECFDLWLVGATHIEFANKLIEAGASPHSEQLVEGSRTTATLALFDAVATHQSFGRYMSWKDADKDYHVYQTKMLEDRLDNWLKTPGATPGQLSQYLERATINSTKMNEDIYLKWRACRDMLLDIGALANFEGSAIDALIRCREGFLRRDCFSEKEVLFEHQQLTGKAISKDEEAAVFSAYWPRMVEVWERRAEDWLDVFLPTLTKSEPFQWSNSGPTKSYFWKQLLKQPNGVSMGCTILDTGLVPPWSRASTSELPPNPLVASAYDAEPTLLRPFVDLLDKHPPSLKTRRKIAQDYIEFRTRRGGANQDPIEMDEFDLILKLSGWSRFDCEPPMDCISRVVMNMPSRWLTSEIGTEEIARRVDGLMASKILKSALDCEDSNSHPTSSAIAIAWAFTQTQVLEKITGSFGSLSPRLELAQALGHISEQKGGVRRHKIHKALSADPQCYSIILDSAYKRAAVADSSSMSASSVVDLVLVCADVVSAPHSVVIDKDFAEKTMALVRNSLFVSRWSMEQQISLARGLSLSNLLFATNLNPVIALLEKEEKQSLSTNFEPFVSALIEDGLDVQILPPIENATRPLARLIQVEQERSYLEASTPQALKPAGQRPYRL